MLKSNFEISLKELKFFPKKREYFPLLPSVSLPPPP